MVAIYLLPESEQCNFLADSVTADALANTKLVDMIESILYKTHKSGQKLTLYDRHQQKATRIDSCETDMAAIQEICHLPKPVLKLKCERGVRNIGGILQTSIIKVISSNIMWIST